MIATNKKNAKFRLAELRHERELTQKELANIIGIDPSTIANYEVGSRSPDYFTCLSKVHVASPTPTLDKLIIELIFKNK